MAKMKTSNPSSEFKCQSPWPHHRSRYRPSSFCWRSGFFAVRSFDPSAPVFGSGGAAAERGVLVAHRLLKPLVFKDNCKVYKSAARIACRPAVALEFGPGIPLRRGSASGDFAGRSRATSRSANSAVDNHLSSPCKPWRAGGTKYAFCPQQLQRLKDYALASRQEYKWLVVDPSLFLAACSLLSSC